MTDEDKNFNKWLKEYNPEQVKVFEETDLKIAYLQGGADEVEKWENKNADLRNQLEQAKEIIKHLLWDLRNKNYNPAKDIKKAEQFLGRYDIKNIPALLEKNNLKREEKQ